MNITSLYSIFLKASGISTDTRQIKENSIYFALKGANFDGNAFAREALTNGAIKAVVDDPSIESKDCILVDDVLTALQQLAAHHRKQMNIPVIGLTGSNGKTTTKELMHEVLSQKYHTLATKGNLNNHIGVPLTLLNLTADHQIAIIEMGANHIGEIEFLCSLCKPDYGYITNFGKAHLEGFGSLQGVIQGKSELYTALSVNDGLAFVNADDPIQIEKAKGLRQVSFGTTTDNDHTFVKVDNQGNYVGIGYQGRNVFSNLTGSYNYSNIAAAYSVGLHFGVEMEKIENAIKGYLPKNNRSQLQKTDRNLLVVDSYNANPSSMEAALNNFRNLQGKHKWVILGDMFELGEQSDSEHQAVVDMLNDMNLEKIILVGKNFQKTLGSGERFQTTQEAAEYLKAQNPQNKSILIKGSRGMKLESLLSAL